VIERYFWIFGLIAVGGAVLLWEFIPRRRRNERFKDREELAMDSIFNQFFAQARLPKALVVELWNEVANALGVPPGKLRPADRFDKELAPVKGWGFDDDIVEVCWAAERRLKKLGMKAEHSDVRTLGDYVEYFCALAGQKQNE